jgi:hypothetical protein
LRVIKLMPAVAEGVDPSEAACMVTEVMPADAKSVAVSLVGAVTVVLVCNRWHTSKTAGGSPQTTASLCA